MDERVLTEELAFAHHLADLAARVTLAGFGSRRAVRLKPDRSPVTEADVEAERAIRDEIARTYPGDAVLGEEHGLDGEGDGRVWVVDPIDGTKLFAEGIPLWTTLIALRERGRVVVGVADAPALGERAHASAGGGAWRGERPIRVSDVTALADALVLHSPVEGWLAHGLPALARLASSARATRGISDGWAQLLVAQGSADAYVELEPCFEWDWAATGLIVAEAGGRVTAFDGGAPSAGRGLVATNGALHEATLGIVGP